MSDNKNSRRGFMKTIGAGALAVPLVAPWLGGSPLVSAAMVDGNQKPSKKQRVVFVFTPNGTVPDEFWPETQGKEFELKKVLQPLAKFKDKMLVLKGVCNQVRGDGDSHMRGMSCLLTGVELMPGNIQGGSDTPAGWAGGISIDQEIKNFLQSSEANKTRFGSLEFGVAVSERADPWTRMCYRGRNKPVAPINDPYTMFSKMYGRNKNDDLLRSVLADVQSELVQTQKSVGQSGEALLEEHVNCVKQMESDLKSAAEQKLAVPVPDFPRGVKVKEENMPTIAKIQMDLLVNGLANDMNRVATLQFSNSVGQTRMKWLGFNESHHELSHDPDLKEESQAKLVKINAWYAEQIAYLVDQLANTKDPESGRPLLDDTLVIWCNELGKGNSHTLQNIPLVLVGGADGFQTGRYLELDNVPLNRLWMTLAHAFGHKVETFGKPELSAGGVLKELG